MSSSNKTHLIFHPADWIDLHYSNLSSPDDEWIKSNPKQSSFVAWILNYLYERTLTLNVSNRNQKEGDREQDSCRTRNQDVEAPAPFHVPLRGSECQSERAPALGENAF